MSQAPWTPETIAERIKSFDRWHYEFDLQGVKTPAFTPGYDNRHVQRQRYLFPPLLRLFGGSLRGKRVLDLGCNAGYWSLAAIEAGADFVLGIDGRRMHIDQANFVFEVKGVEPARYRFLEGNLFDCDFAQFGSFDVVLFFGLLYHVNKPFELMERIARVNSDVMLIDTTLAAMGGSYWQTYREGLDQPTNAVDYEVVLRPTKQAVFDMAATFGYRAVMLRPQFTSYVGARDFQIGTRRAFLCSKRTPLDAVQGEAEPVNLLTHAADTALSVVGIARRWARRAGLMK